MARSKPKRPAHRPASMQLAEFSDRELLHILLDVADNDGAAEAQAVADRIGIKHDHPTHCVSSRLAWLKRYGVVEKLDDETGSTRWRLTSAGERFALGQLTAEQAQLVQSLTDEALVPVMSALTGHYRQAGMVGASLIRREWLYGTHKFRVNGRRA